MPEIKMKKNNLVNYLVATYLVGMAGGIATALPDFEGKAAFVGLVLWTLFFVFIGIFWSLFIARKMMEVTGDA